MKFSPLKSIVLSLALSQMLCGAIQPADEPWIPFQAKLLSAVDVNTQKTLQPGQDFVVIRVEEEVVIADVPRVGVVEMPLKSTNIESEIAKAKDSGVEIVPRMALFLGNRIVSGESNWEYPLRSPQVNTFEKWYLLYMDASSSDLGRIIPAADGFYKSMDAELRKVTALVLMDPSGNKQALNAIRDEYSPSFQMMPGYLARGYCKSLSHIDEAGTPVLVEVNGAGRILEKVYGVDAITQWFSARED